MKVFLDANVLFSAAVPGSQINALVRTLIKRSACVTNAHAVMEAERNVQLKFPAHVPTLATISGKVPLVAAMVDVRDQKLPAKDHPILGGSIAGKCTHLVTGDRKDFGHLLGRSVHGVKVVTPRMLAEELVTLGWAEAPPKP